MGLCKKNALMTQTNLFIRRAKDFRGTRRKQCSTSWGPRPYFASFSFPMSLGWRCKLGSLAYWIVRLPAWLGALGVSFSLPERHLGFWICSGVPA